MGFELKDKAFFAARYARQMRTRSDKNQNELSLAEYAEKAYVHEPNSETDEFCSCFMPL